VARPTFANPQLQLEKYLKLPQKGKVIAEYVWIDGSNGLRSKCKVSTSRFYPHFHRQDSVNWRGSNKMAHPRDLRIPHMASSIASTGLPAVPCYLWRSLPGKVCCAVTSREPQQPGCAARLVAF
jgi:hypothetical protein